MPMLKTKKHSASEALANGFVAGLMLSAYAVIVGIFFVIAEAAFPAGGSFVFLGAFALLILATMSAAVVGALIFGYPVAYLLEKKNTEALYALSSTVLTLFAIFFLMIFLAIIFSAI
jgi:hypothetical protein